MSPIAVPVRLGYPKSECVGKDITIESFHCQLAASMLRIRTSRMCLVQCGVRGVVGIGREEREEKEIVRGRDKRRIKRREMKESVT